MSDTVPIMNRVAAVAVEPKEHCLAWADPSLKGNVLCFARRTLLIQAGTAILAADHLAAADPVARGDCHHSGPCSGL